MFSIRTASDDDYDSVYSLFSQVQALHAGAVPQIFRKPTKDNGFRTFFEGFFDDNEHFLALAIVDEAPVGYIQYFLGERPQNSYQPARRFAYIHQLVVDAESRRKGYGSALIEFVKAKARDEGIREFGIDFWSFNEAARGCFERQGFETLQERMWLFE